MLTSNSVIILFLIVMPSMVLTRAPSSQFSSPNMDTLCNAVITLDGDSFPGTFFSFTSKKYKPNVQCLLTIKGSTASQRIIVVVEKFDVECGGDKLLVYDGKKDSATLLNTDTSKQRGKKTYYLRILNTNTAVIEFVSNSDGLVGEGFTLNAAIHFPVSACSSDKGLYKCGSSYCISKIFKCETRNWCGDGSQNIVC